MKRINTALGLIALIAALCLTATGCWAAEVSQGKCLQYDEAKHLITIEEYNTQFSAADPYGKSTGTRLVFNVANAQIGIKPQAGDILRLAWVAGNNEKTALKVMNVSKQNLMKK